eukprot:6201712-Pleurochrysis_carterae.AAC.9
MHWRAAVEVLDASAILIVEKKMLPLMFFLNATGHAARGRPRLLQRGDCVLNTINYQSAIATNKSDA